MSDMANKPTFVVALTKVTRNAGDLLIIQVTLPLKALLMQVTYQQRKWLTDNKSDLSKNAGNLFYKQVTYIYLQIIY